MCKEVYPLSQLHCFNECDIIKLSKKTISLIYILRRVKMKKKLITVAIVIAGIFAFLVIRAAIINIF